MCYHISLAAGPSELAARYGRKADLIERFKPLYHVSAFSYPEYPVVTSDLEIELFRWGLIPFWADELEDAFELRYRTFNARAETVTEKPMFRRSIAFQRCVIPATGFYEWDAAKHKYFFQMPGQPLYLAGIYDNISGVNCFIILTTEPNDSVAPIHDRMPLLLSHEQVRPWLVDAGAALELLCSRPPLLQRTSCDGQLGFDDLA